MCIILIRRLSYCSLLDLQKIQIESDFIEVPEREEESQKRQEHPDDHIFSLPESTEEAIARILS